MQQQLAHVSHSRDERLAAKLRRMKKWRLIVRNLPFETTVDELRTHFASRGELHEVLLPEKNGRKGGYGFVQFLRFPDAYHAMKNLNASNFGGRLMAVDWAVPKDTFMSAQMEQTDKSKTLALAEKFAQKVPPESGLAKPSSKKRKANKIEKVEGKNVSAKPGIPAKKIKQEPGSVNVKQEPGLVVQGQDFSGSVRIKQEPGAIKVKQEPVSSDEEDSEDEEDVDSAESSDASDAESGNDESEEGSENESDEGADKEKSGFQPRKRPEVSKDVQEGRTVFVRNLAFETTGNDLQQHFAQFGAVKYGLVCMFPGTDHSKGSGFVQFDKKEDAEKCVEAYSVESERATKFALHGRIVAVCMAIPRGQVAEIEKKKHEKAPKDSRNLHLLRVSRKAATIVSENLLQKTPNAIIIRPGSKEAKGMSDLDTKKRLKMEAYTRKRLANLNIFVSPTRVCVHNMPRKYTDADLRRICLNAVDNDPTCRIKECRIMRDLNVVDADGKGRSKGYGFVQFVHAHHALACLEALNNNPEIFTNEKRPIVEFSLEDRNAIKRREKRFEKSQAVLKEKLAAATSTAPSTSQTASSATAAANKKAQLAGWFNDKNQPDLTKSQSTVKLPKGMKPMPSHMGPKIRHKRRENTKAPVGRKPKGKLSRKHLRTKKSEEGGQASFPKKTRAASQRIRGPGSLQGEPKNSSTATASDVPKGKKKKANHRKSRFFGRQK